MVFHGLVWQVEHKKPIFLLISISTLYGKTVLAYLDWQDVLKLNKRTKKPNLVYIPIFLQIISHSRKTWRGTSFKMHQNMHQGTYFLVIKTNWMKSDVQFACLVSSIIPSNRGRAQHVCIITGWVGVIGDCEMIWPGCIWGDCNVDNVGIPYIGIGDVAAFTVTG